jgi:hypothetical protein
MILILPNLHRGPRRFIRWAGENAPVVCGDWKRKPDGTVTAGYDRDEFIRALALIARETGRRIRAEMIMMEVFGE